jgi:hypothetical protein
MQQKLPQKNQYAICDTESLAAYKQYIFLLLCNKYMLSFQPLLNPQYQNLLDTKWETQVKVTVATVNSHNSIIGTLTHIQNMTVKNVIQEEKLEVFWRERKN